MKTESYLRSRLDQIVPKESQPMLENILFMAKYKYDKYELYKPGLRFLSYFVPWLEQFSERERIVMVKLIDNLMYISEEEMQSLSSIMFQKICHELLEEIIIAEGLDEFDFNTAFSVHFQKYLGESIFVGMSDGSRIGYFRRHSVVLPRDSVLEFYKVDEWEKRQLAKKRFAFLVDDFCGSGTTFIRGEDKKGKTVPSGQLQRFIERWSSFVRFERIFYCPYVITTGACSRINKLVSGSGKIIDIKARFKILYSMLIPADHSCIFSPSRVFDDIDLERIRRVCDKYYDRFQEDNNMKKYGGCRYGFGETGLAIAIYHNTPNNCIYPIWNTTMKWHPLFPRIPKHK